MTRAVLSRHHGRTPTSDRGAGRDQPCPRATPGRSLRRPFSPFESRSTRCWRSARGGASARHRLHQAQRCRRPGSPPKRARRRTASGVASGTLRPRRLRSRNSLHPSPCIAGAAAFDEVAGAPCTEAHRTVRTMSGSATPPPYRRGRLASSALSPAKPTCSRSCTIEAARAGASGKGFAVVAAEVKSLAGQTQKATEEIASQVGAIQSAVADAAQAIEQVNASSGNVAIAATVANTVEEQNTPSPHRRRRPSRIRRGANAPRP